MRSTPYLLISKLNNTLKTSSIQPYFSMSTNISKLNTKTWTWTWTWTCTTEIWTYYNFSDPNIAPLFAALYLLPRLSLALKDEPWVLSQLIVSIDSRWYQQGKPRLWQHHKNCIGTSNTVNQCRRNIIIDRHLDQYILAII